MCVCVCEKNKYTSTFAKNADPDEMPQNEAFHLGIFTFMMKHNIPDVCISQCKTLNHHVM